MSYIQIERYVNEYTNLNVTLIYIQLRTLH